MNRKFFKSKPKAPTVNNNTNNNNKNTIASTDSSTISDEYKTLISSHSYLGSRGYTIPKELITKEDEEFLRRDLFVKPVTFGPGAGAGAGAGESAYPVYRESSKKMYVPRFYGIARYGLPGESKIEPGDDISVQFTKPLRDYQDKIIGTYIDYVNKPICLDAANTQINGDGGILEVPCGRGKCLGINTPILMYDGTIRLVQDIKIGDVLMGDDSTPRNVLSLARGKEMMYKVVSKKGDGYIVNESHILSLKSSTMMNKQMPKGSVVDMSVLEYLALPKSYHGRGGPLLGYRVPILFPEKNVELDPYLLGYWLGDGSLERAGAEGAGERLNSVDGSRRSSKGTIITTQDSTVIKYIVNCFKTKHTSLYLKYTGQQYDYRINSIESRDNFMMNFLRNNNLINHKHIPHHYKCNSRKIQLELLAGLIDSDGYYHDNCYEIVQKNETLLDDIVFLSKSLGFSAMKRKTHKTCTNSRGREEVELRSREFTDTEYRTRVKYSKNGPITGTYFTTSICGVGLEDIPVKCVRKMAHPRKLIRDCLKYRIKLEKLEVDDYYGFEIDGNRRFVLGDFTVTHNTVMSIKIISLLSKKTLILVHKEFLMNQWIDRIAEFLPGAKVGKIQGPIFDVVGKDIVIGMIQSLYDKEFPQDAFTSFGLTIIDEVHRIGSEQFSKTLLKIVTPYMLGISATVERKDKLTKVLYMFIGDKIYSEKRKDEDPVCVRAIEYGSNDTHFNEVEYDFKGMTKYSTMITKLCEFGPRSDFIVRVLKDLIEESPDSQIMVLCHNRSLLTYLHEAIEHKQIASAGFYVGGMKQDKLQATESMQIVLATYAMAAEALDIKTLSTLVMVTPKTDITQSVGRILRVRHDNPIVVDIVDKHDIFQNQWKQRRQFYKRCNYRIRKIDIKQYSGMNFDWKTDSTWTRVFEPKIVANEPICQVELEDPDPEDLDQDQDPDASKYSNFESKSALVGKCVLDASVFDQITEF
jgi:superfamily II DNA or RNA helicase